MEPSSQQHSRDCISSRRGFHLIGIFFATIFSSAIETNAELGRLDSSNAVQGGPQLAYTASNTTLNPGIDPYNILSNRLWRGQSKEQYIWQRQLFRKRSGSSGGSASDYNGCLSYSDEELKSRWKFQGTALSCSYVHHSSGRGGGGSGGGSNGSSSGSSSGSSGGGSSSSSSGSSSGGGGSGSSSGSSGGGSSSSSGSSGGGNNGNGNNGSGNGGNGGGNGNGNDNEVVYNGDYGTDNDDGGNDNNPYYDFDITKCDTYENLWMWDLSLTCNDSESLDNCKCTFTEELLAYGYLTCYDKALCPSDCQICETCLQIVGCSRAGKHLVSTDNFSFFIIASAVGVLVVATVVYLQTRQDKKQNGLGAHLMEDNPKAGTHSTEVNTNRQTNWDSPTEIPDMLAPSQFSPTNVTKVPIPLGTIDELSFHEACAEEPGIVWLAPIVTKVPTPLGTTGEISFHEARAEEPEIVWLAPM